MQCSSAVIEIYMLSGVSSKIIPLDSSKDGVSVFGSVAPNWVYLLLTTLHPLFACNGVQSY